MTPAEFRAILDHLGLTQAVAARMIDVDDSTIRRYVEGTRTMRRPTAKLLRLAGPAGSSPRTPGTTRSVA
jgi:DNA-binding transcriptional regulator YiaG